MSITIGNKKYCNLQEQVGFLTSEIEAIQKYLDGIELKDKLVVVESSSGSLSPEELLVLQGPLAFVAYNKKVYIKSGETSTQILFRALDVEASLVGNAYYNIGGSKITVDITDPDAPTYAVADDPLITTYNKSQIDSIISNIMATKADITALAAYAPLAGATFTGEITAPSIIETMSGYSYSTDYGFTSSEVTNVYVGVCKTGNKLTYVHCLKLKYVDNNQPRFGRLYLPAAVMAKLYTLPDSQWNELACQLVTLYEVGSYSSPSGFTKNVIISKDSANGFILAGINGINDLTVGKEYFVRLEITFLLSDNLAS